MKQMQFEKYIQRIDLVNELIRKRSTGSPNELARKLGISKRMALYYMEYLREGGAKISYDRTRMTYYFSDDSSAQ